MKTKIALISTLFIAIIISACNGATTPTNEQIFAVENTPQTTSAIEPATAKPAQPDVVSLTVNKSSNMSFAPIFIADAEGYFDEYGIKMDYVTFNKISEAVALLVSGDLDVYAGTANAGLLNVLSQSDNVKAVADRGHIQPGGCTYHAIVVRKDLFDSGEITNAAGLAGQTIASTSSGVDGYLLGTYLAQAGLTFEDVELNDIPDTAKIDALANKSLAAIVTPELDLSRLLQAGNAAILVGAEDVLGTFQISVVAFGEKLLVENREAGARFLAAYLKGVRQYNEGKTERNLQILTEATGESVDVLQAACWVPIRADGSLEYQAVEAYQQWLVKYDQLENPVTEEQFWDQSFLAAALKLLQP